MRKAIFIDKDGTLIKNIPYNVRTELVELEEGVGHGLSFLSLAGFEFFIVSNQSGIARGIFDVKKLHEVSEKIESLLNPFCIKIAQFYYCPHHPLGKVKKYARKCFCRKPSPGLLLTAAKKHNIDLQSSWMVGDILTDIEAGKKAGCKTILIDNGNETKWKITPQNTPDYICTTFIHAAGIIYSVDTKQIHPRSKLFL